MSLQLLHYQGACFSNCRRSVKVGSTPRISGVDTSCLTIADVQTNDLGRYCVVVRADNGSVTSAPAELWVGPLTTFVSKTILPSGVYQVDFLGEPGRLYNIEATTDFETWLMITNFYCGQGTITIVDWQSTNYPHRYYRAVGP